MIFGSHWPDYRVRGLCAIMRPMRVAISALILALAIGAAAKGPDPLALDKAGERWVDATLKKMTLDEKVGQLLVPSFESTFLPTDSDGFEALAKLVHEAHVGGFHVFGGSEPAPQVLLNPTYGTVTLGQPLAAASILNRLQAISPVPLLNTADFEAGVGFRIAGATRVSPRDGVRRGGRRAARARGGTHHRPSRRARSASTSTSRRSST